MKKANLLQRPGAYLGDIESGGYFIHLAHVVPTKKKDTYQISSGFRTCRDYFLGLTIKAAQGKIFACMSTDKARILFVQKGYHSFVLDTMTEKEAEKCIRESTEKHKKVIENGRNILHIMEDAAGWPRTTFYEMIPVAKRKYPSTTAIMAVGSKRWIKTPYSLSLFILLIRSGRMEELQDVENYEDLVSRCIRIKKKHEDVNRREFSSDRARIAESCLHWLFFMKNQARIFKGLRNVEGIKIGTSGYYGISSFLTQGIEAYEGVGYKNKAFRKRYLEMWNRSKAKEAIMKQFEARA